MDLADRVLDGDGAGGIGLGPPEGRQDDGDLAHRGM
jgi:hypothetical protein